jgi:phosphohistidine phosphatase
MRHAKSSWDDPALADHDRPLTTRGRKAVPRMAKYMRDKRPEPSVVLCTSAVRARQTLELLQPVIPDVTTIKIEPKLYTAGSKELMTRIRRLSQAAPSVLIVGHNPSMQELILALAEEGSISNVIRKKFPTAALAVLDAPIDEWRHLEPGKAALVDFITPKSLRA